MLLKEYIVRVDEKYTLVVREVSSLSRSMTKFCCSYPFLFITRITSDIFIYRSQPMTTTILTLYLKITKLQFSEIEVGPALVLNWCIIECIMQSARVFIIPRLWTSTPEGVGVVGAQRAFSSFRVWEFVTVWRLFIGGGKRSADWGKNPMETKTIVSCGPTS